MKGALKGVSRRRHAGEAPRSVLELVRVAAQTVPRPSTIGGIDLRTAVDVVAAGAERLAVVRAIRDAGDPERAARRLRALLPA